MTDSATLPVETATRLSEEIESVVEKLFQLPASQRLEIARRLDASVSQSEIDQAWSAEIARRIQEIETGAVELIPADVVFREAEERLNARA